MEFLLSLLLFSFCVYSQGQITLSPGPVITTVEGRSVSFTCTGTSGPQILQVNNNVTTIGGRITSTGEGSGMDTDSSMTYQMSGLRRADNGTVIQCFTNGESSNVITIIVDFPPLYSPDTVSYIVMEGSSPLIQLGLDAAPRITNYTWSHNGAHLSSTTVGLTVNTIQFDRVSRSHSGQYEVTAVDMLGSGTATISLSVYYAPEFAGGSDTVNRSVVAGTDITLDCSVSAANPTVSNISLNYELTGTGVSNIDTSRDNSFIIRGATTDNEGSYTCTATNLVAISQLTYDLMVGSLPDVTIQLSFNFTTQSIIINTLVLTDNSPQPVLRYRITVNGNNYTTVSFPLTIDRRGFRDGQSYQVTVVAENAIGSVPIVVTSFTLPSPTPTPTPSPSPSPSPTSDTVAGTAGPYSLSLIAMCILVMITYYM